MAAAKEISLGDAIVAFFPELAVIFTLKEETALKAFLDGHRVFLVTREHPALARVELNTAAQSS